MLIKDLNFYHSAIFDVSKDVARIDAPVVRGTKHIVFIATGVDSVKTVFRFCDKDIAIRNHDISRILVNRGIAVPHVQLHSYHGQFFETYPYISGITLAESIRFGMPKSQTPEIFYAIAANIKKMSDIPIEAFNDVPNKNCSDVAMSNILKKKESWLLGQGVKYGTVALNAGRHSVCHCDLGPNNIIMDARDGVSAILDLDAVSIANVNFSIATAGVALERHGLDFNKFYRICHDVMPRLVSKSRIELSHKICKMYFRAYTK